MKADGFSGLPSKATKTRCHLPKRCSGDRLRVRVALRLPPFRRVTHPGHHDPEWHRLARLKALDQARRSHSSRTESSPALNRGDTWPCRFRPSRYPGCTSSCVLISSALDVQLYRCLEHHRSRCETTEYACVHDRIHAGPSAAHLYLVAVQEDVSLRRWAAAPPVGCACRPSLLPRPRIYSSKFEPQSLKIP